MHLNPAPVDLGTVLKDMKELFVDQARSKGLELIVGELPQAIVVETDELRLRQALINLLGNAIRYTKEGRVELAVTLGDRRLTFAVSDSGPGIGDADRDRIFKPFQRLDPADQTGAGLGLSITQHLVSAMGGELVLDSEPGQGSNFHFSLPLGAGQAPVPAESFHGLRVLLVEDDPDARAIYQLFLADFGLTVDSASSLGDGIAHIAESRYDLVITDLHLDGESGADLLAAVRAAQPDCRTLLCSGAGASADWRERFGAMADDFLQKPVLPENLRAALERVMAHNH